MDRCVFATFTGACNFLSGGSREWRHISTVLFVPALEERVTLLADGRFWRAFAFVPFGSAISGELQGWAFVNTSASGAYRFCDVSDEIDAHIIRLTGTRLLCCRPWDWSAHRSAVAHRGRHFEVRSRRRDA